MFKHPWFPNNYRYSEKELLIRKADRFYWSCVALSGALLGWNGFWINAKEIGPKSHPSIAIPVSIMFFILVMLVGGLMGDTLPRKGKYIAGMLFLLVMLVSANAVRVLSY